MQHTLPILCLCTYRDPYQYHIKFGRPNRRRTVPPKPHTKRMASPPTRQHLLTARATTKTTKTTMHTPHYDTRLPHRSMSMGDRLQQGLDRITCPSSARSVRASMQARLALLRSFVSKSVYVVQKRLGTIEKWPQKWLVGRVTRPPTLVDRWWHVVRVGAARERCVWLNRCNSIC
jgi:hypothetical protein